MQCRGTTRGRLGLWVFTQSRQIETAICAEDLRGDNRPSVLKFDFVGGPGTAGRAAAQGRNRQPELVSRLERLARPSVANKRAWTHTFQVPDSGVAVVVVDLQQDKGMRAGKLELLHCADKLPRAFLIEHGERVMGRYTAGKSQQRAACQDCHQLAPSHPNLLGPRHCSTARRHWHIADLAAPYQIESQAQETQGNWCVRPRPIAFS